MFFEGKAFRSITSTFKLLLSIKTRAFFSPLVDELSDVFFPKYFGLFVNPVGFELSFFVKLDFPL